MKIDTDLRLAIKAAERAQPHDYDGRDKREQEAIARFLKDHPAKARRVRALAKKAKRCYAEYQKANALIHDGFGLQTSENRGSGFCISGYGPSQERFAKAGGKLPLKTTRWKADNVIAQIAAATPKEGAKLIKNLGINWQ